MSNVPGVLSSNLNKTYLIAVYIKKKTPFRALPLEVAGLGFACPERSRREPRTFRLWAYILNPCYLCGGFYKSDKPTNAGSCLPGTQR
jgi:hypothetical protein